MMRLNMTLPLVAVAFFVGCTPETVGVAGSNTLANAGGETTDQKQCCFNGECSVVDDDITACDTLETAQTCDDDGENCTNHGGSDFP